MNKPSRRAVVSTKKFALDSHHIASVLLALACVVVPLAEQWVGPFSWKALLTLLPGALVSFWMLVQKSPKDLAAHLESLKPVEAKDSSSKAEAETKSEEAKEETEKKDGV